MCIMTMKYSRNALQHAESNARDVRQASVAKELLHYEMVEKLREQINTLEGDF